MVTREQVNDAGALINSTIYGITGAAGEANNEAHRVANLLRQAWIIMNDAQRVEWAQYMIKR